MKIGIYLKDELNDSDISTLLISKINEYGFEFDNDDPELVIFVGGDGTLLRAIDAYIDQLDNIVFAGINQGALGFYCDYDINDIDELFSEIQNNQLKTNVFHLIEADIGRSKTIYALNEIRIENPFHTLISHIYIDDEYLEVFRGNGLSICSSLGSTAYNKSLGGSVVLPKFETLQLTEIAPINNKVYHSINSSLVVPQDSEIKLSGNFSEAVIGFDHLTTKEDADEIVIKLSNKAVVLVEKKDRTFIDKIKEAFNLSR